MNDTTHLDLARPDSGDSPFDAIKRTDEHGEYWDGRELMPLLDYDRWENFAEVIEKARVAITAAGGDPDIHASRRHEASGRTRRANYRLTRYVLAADKHWHPLTPAQRGILLWAYEQTLAAADVGDEVPLPALPEGVHSATLRALTRRGLVADGRMTGLAVDVVGWALPPKDRPVEAWTGAS